MDHAALEDFDWQIRLALAQNRNGAKESPIMIFMDARPQSAEDMIRALDTVATRIPGLQPVTSKFQQQLREAAGIAEPAAPEKTT